MNLIKNMSLSQWAFFKIFFWFCVNIFFIIRNYILVDAFIINVFIWLIYMCTKIHSTSEGIYVGMSKIPIRKEEHIEFPSPHMMDKKDIN